MDETALAVPSQNVSVVPPVAEEKTTNFIELHRTPPVRQGTNLLHTAPIRGRSNKLIPIIFFMEL